MLCKIGILYLSWKNFKTSNKEFSEQFQPKFGPVCVSVFMVTGKGNVEKSSGIDKATLLQQLLCGGGWVG
jgi:hypothetical protein